MTPVADQALLDFLDELAEMGWTVQFRRRPLADPAAVSLELYGGPSEPVRYPQDYSAATPSEALEMCFAAVHQEVA